MRFARIAQLMSAALFPLLTACSLLTGQQNIPPPWDSTAAPAEPVLPPGAQNHFAPSPSFLRLAGDIGNPTGYPQPRTDPVVPPPTPVLAPVSQPAPVAVPISVPAAPSLSKPTVMVDGVQAMPLAQRSPQPALPAVSVPVGISPELSGAQPGVSRSGPGDVERAPAIVAPVTTEAAPLKLAESDTSSKSEVGARPMPESKPPAATAPVTAVPQISITAPPPSENRLPDGFVVGPGDLVTISVFGRPELAVTANVSDDGRVPMALIGNIKIGGLSPGQASDRIAAALRDGQYLIDPKVSVVLSEYRSRQVSVLGEVKAPGRFPVNTRLTVLDAIALAGGINELGSQSALILRPQGSIVTRYEVDIDELLDAGVGQQYFDVEGGDTVIIPRAEVFYIYGEVKTPNMYKLRPGMTVVQALSMGGGLTDKGSDWRVEIRRRSPDGKLVKQSASLSDVLEPDDVVYVHERLF